MRQIFANDLTDNGQYPTHMKSAYNSSSKKPPNLKMGRIAE